MSGLKPIAAPVLLMLLAGNAPDTELTLTIERMRNERGMLHLCLTQDARYFPDCADDSQAISRSVPASTRSVVFDGLSPGSYAVSILHDENRNDRMDSFLGVPREGFGFSGNAAPLFGPPNFEKAAIELEAGSVQHVVRMRYLL